MSHRVLQFCFFLDLTTIKFVRGKNLFCFSQKKDPELGRSTFWWLHPPVWAHKSSWNPFFFGGKKVSVSRPMKYIKFGLLEKGSTQNAHSGTRVFKTRVPNAKPYRRNMLSIYVYSWSRFNRISNFIRTISNCVIRTKGTAIAIDITKQDDATGKPVKSPSCQWLGQHLQTSGWGDKWSRRHCHGRSPSFGSFVKQDEAIAFKLRTQSSKDIPTSNFWPYQSSDPSAITKTKLESTSFVFKAIFTKCCQHPILFW